MEVCGWCIVSNRCFPIDAGGGGQSLHKLARYYVGYICMKGMMLTNYKSFYHFIQSSPNSCTEDKNVRIIDICEETEAVILLYHLAAFTRASPFHLLLNVVRQAGQASDADAYY